MSAASQTEDHYEGTPGPSQGALVAAAKWEGFQREVRARESDIAAMLPRHVSRERFIASAIAAAKQNPDILFANQRTVFAAITKSAQDGILPDGREGVITVYSQKIKGTSQYEKVAQWNPMTHGLRKRARELAGIIIDAQVVYKNDTFIWTQGDNPGIVHSPAPLGSPRGEKIGAYAIFKQEGGQILHREVMDVAEIEATREQSKASNSLMWTTFQSEGYRKAVIRRGIKTVPVSEDLEQIVRREDDNFDFGQQGVPGISLTPPPAPPAGTLTPPPSPPSPPSAPVSEPVASQAPPNAYTDWLADIKAELAGCETQEAVEDLRDRALNDLDAADVPDWKDACAARADQIVIARAT